MKLSYDEHEDTLHLIFLDTESVTTNLGEGVRVDRDHNGTLTRVSIRDVAVRSGQSNLFGQIMLEGFGSFPQNDPLIIVPAILARYAAANDADE